MNRKLPSIIEEVGFDFDWDEKKVWALELPVEEVKIDELTWHLDIPFLFTKPNGYYDLKPSQVLENPDDFNEEYSRTINADLSFPIDVMFWRGRWVILDGLHRLMKANLQGQEEVSVRKVPNSAIQAISK